MLWVRRLPDLVQYIYGESLKP